MVSTFPLRSIIHKPELLCLLAKRAIELSEFGITYQHRRGIKSQVLSAFIANFSANILFEAEKEAIIASKNVSKT